MKKLLSLIIAMLISCMLIMPLTVSVSATGLADLFSKDGIGALLGTLGVDLNDPESIKKAIDELQNGGLGDLVGLLGVDVNDLVSELQNYLIDFENETTAPPTTEVESSTSAEVTTMEETTMEDTTVEVTTKAPSEDVTTKKEEPTSKKNTSSSANSRPQTVNPTDAPAEETLTGEEATSAENESTTLSQQEESTVSETGKSEKPVFELSQVIVLMIVSIVIFAAGLGIGVKFARKKTE